MKILITGGFGFLGGRIGAFFASLGHDVILASRRTIPPYNINFPHHFLHINPYDKVSLFKACTSVDIVIHAAGMNSSDCNQSPSSAFHFNCYSTSLLVEASIKAGVSRFIYLSTAHIYSSPLSGQITEDVLPNNYHPYATSNLSGEYAVLSSPPSDSTKIHVFRLSNCFGAPINASVNCWSLFINNLCKEVTTQKTITLRSNGGIQRDFLPITDLLEFFEKLFFSSEFDFLPSSSPINIGYGRSFTLMDIATEIQSCSQYTLGFSPSIYSPSNLPTPALHFSSKYFCFTYVCPTNFLTEIHLLLNFCSSAFS